MGRIVPIICPTRDHHGAIAGTMFNIVSAIYRLGRTPIYLQLGGYGYAAVRTAVVGYARDELTKSLGKNITRARGFLVDDDVLVPNIDELLTTIRMADEHNWNVVAPYALAMEEGDEQLTSIATYVRTGDEIHTRMLSKAEVNKLKPWDVLETAGLGFYYGDIPLDYTFHSDGKPFQGEDFNFFWDHKSELQIRLAPLHLKHCKSVLL